MSITPLAKWDDRSPELGRLVWVAQLDGRYQIEVQRVDGADLPAVLAIFDHDQDMSLVRSWPVGLAFDARFGPDVEDVMLWQKLVEAQIDSGEE
jgi:hypothetical protein